MFNHKDFYLTSGDVCYAGETSTGRNKWRWFSTTLDPCECTRLELAASRDGTRNLFIDNIVKIREILQVSCPVKGKYLFAFLETLLWLYKIFVKTKLARVV